MMHYGKRRKSDNIVFETRNNIAYSPKELGDDYDGVELPDDIKAGHAWTGETHESL